MRGRKTGNKNRKSAEKGRRLTVGNTVMYAVKVPVVFCCP